THSTSHKEGSLDSLALHGAVYIRPNRVDGIRAYHEKCTPGTIALRRFCVSLVLSCRVCSRLDHVSVAAVGVVYWSGCALSRLRFADRPTVAADHPEPRRDLQLSPSRCAESSSTRRRRDWLRPFLHCRRGSNEPRRRHSRSTR